MRKLHPLSALLVACVTGGCAGQGTPTLEQRSIDHVAVNMKEMHLMDYGDGLPLYVYPKVMRSAKNRLLNDGNSQATKLFEFIWPEDVFQVDTLYRPEEIGAPSVELSKKCTMASSAHQSCDSCAVLSVNNRIRFKGYDYVVVHVEVHPSYSTCDVYFKYDVNGSLIGKATVCGIE